MQQPAPLRAPTKSPHDFSVCPTSDVSLKAAKTVAKAARNKKETKRSIASIRKKNSTPNPRGLADTTYTALKYLAKNTSHLLKMECCLTSKGEDPPEGFSSTGQLRKMIRHYKDVVLPRRSQLKDKIGEYNAALARKASDLVLKPLKDRVAALEEEIEEGSTCFPAWAGCTVKPTVFIKHAPFRSAEDRAGDSVGVSMDTASK